LKQDTVTIKTHKKLVEVALPLDAIDKASAREEPIRHGQPSTLERAWAEPRHEPDFATPQGQVVGVGGARLLFRTGEPS
jgi:hypothetical protein